MFGSTIRRLCQYFTLHPDLLTLVYVQRVQRCVFVLGLHESVEGRHLLHLVYYCLYGLRLRNKTVKISFGVCVEDYLVYVRLRRLRTRVVGALGVKFPVTDPRLRGDVFS